MSLSFPRAMPAHSVRETRFKLQRVDYLTPETGGRVGAVTAGFPLWTGRWVLAPMAQARSDEWETWLDAQRGAQRLFFGRDYRRPLPLAYAVAGFEGLTKAGGGAFTGAATSWSVNGARDVLSLTNLPVGFILSRGDYVDFRWTTDGAARRALVRIVEPATAAGDGGASVSIEPPLPSLTSAGAVANLNQPECLMRLTSETEYGDAALERFISGTIVAVQELLA